MNPYSVAARVDYENYRRPGIEKNVTCYAPSNDSILLGRGRVRMKGMPRIISLGFVLVFGFSLALLCAHADTIYLSTYNLNTIAEFNSSGNQSTFATAASGLNYPAGLAFNGSGDLYVVNTGGGLQGSPSIETFSASGTGSVFTTSGLSYPADLAFDENGNLYVANAGNNTIEEFNSSGTGTVFATSASGVDSPFGLAFDGSGNLYVANYNNTILKLSPSGTGTVFATSGLDNPRALAFDSSGNLYVANYGNNTIEKFGPNGQPSIFASYSTNGLGQYLQGPIGLAFDSSGDLFVADHFSESILEIDPNGDMSLFASGLSAADYLADEVPEPSTLLLAALGALSLVAFLNRKRT